MSKPLRILQIVPSISLVYGGPSQMVKGLAAALASQGVEVTVLTTDSNGDTGQPPLDVPLDQPVEQDGYQVRYFHCSPFRRYKFSLELLRWLWQHAPEFDLAHIHALFSPVSTATAAIARYKKLPYILRPLGTLDPADLQKKRRLKQIYAALLEQPNLAGAAGVHFTSVQEAKVSERFGTTPRELVLPLGVDSALLQTASLVATPQAVSAQATTSTTLATRPQTITPRSKPRLLFMSRIDPKKGLDLLIPALEQLLTEGLEFHFVLAGSNPQDSAYEQQIRDRLQASSLGQHTTIAGFVTGDQKLELLRSADLFVLPSYYENFGIAVAEAMAAGVPVVISDQVHIWHDIQQAKAGWVTSCNTVQLTAQLRSALEDPTERQQRSKNAQLHAQTHYSWDAIAQQVIDRKSVV